MDINYQVLLAAHIISGFLALFVAPAAMAVKKGGNAHRFWGKLFFWSITMVAITSIVMSVLKPNLFMAMIGFFSFYLVASGYRALYRRNVNSLKEVGVTDWVLLSVSGVVCLGMVITGSLILINSISASFGYIALLFGIIGFLLVLSDVRSFTIPGHHKKKWMNHHMGGMLGGYIATVSAFSVVNLEFLPGLVRWLWPTFIGVPLIFYHINTDQKKNPSS